MDLNERIEVLTKENEVLNDKCKGIENNGGINDSQKGINELDKESNEKIIANIKENEVLNARIIELSNENTKINEELTMIKNEFIKEKEELTKTLQNLESQLKQSNELSKKVLEEKVILINKVKDTLEKSNKFRKEYTESKDSIESSLSTLSQILKELNTNMLIKIEANMKIIQDKELIFSVM